MANITITYNPKAGGRVRVTTGAGPDTARRGTLHQAGFIFNEGAVVGFFSPGGRGFGTIVADFSADHSDTLTLTESTAGYYADGSE